MHSAPHEPRAHSKRRTSSRRPDCQTLSVKEIGATRSFRIELTVHIVPEPRHAVFEDWNEFALRGVALVERKRMDARLDESGGIPVAGIIRAEDCKVPRAGEAAVVRRIGIDAGGDAILRHIDPAQIVADDTTVLDMMSVRVGAAGEDLGAVTPARRLPVVFAAMLVKTERIRRAMSRTVTEDKTFRM